MEVIHCGISILFIFDDTVEGFVFPKMATPPKALVAFSRKESLHPMENLGDRNVFRDAIKLMHVVGHTAEIVKLKAKEAFALE